MKINLVSAFAMYILFVGTLALMASCGGGQNSESALHGASLSNDAEDAHQSAPTVDIDEIKAVEEKVKSIDEQTTEKRRLIIDGLKGEAEVTYDSNKKVVKIVAELNSDNGTEEDTFYFENGVLTYSEHHHYIHPYSAQIEHYVIDQRLFYDANQKIKGSYARFGEVDASANFELKDAYKPYDIELEVTEEMKMNRLTQIKESLRI